MKRLLLIIFIGVASVPMALAQHYISLTGQFGEHSITGVPDALARASLGFGTGAGINYELKVDNFLFSVGVAGAFSRSTFTSSHIKGFLTDDGDSNGHAPTVDGVRGEFFYTYDFYKRKDTYADLTLQVPLMMGGTWNRFYFLVGAKFQTFSLWGNWKSSAEFNSYGEYSSIMAPRLDHMPDHGFYDGEKLEMPTANSKFKLNVLASAELGWWLAPEYYPFSRRKNVPPTWRVSAYVDYGVLNAYDYSAMLSPYKTPLVYNAAQPTQMRDDVQLLDLLATDARGEAVRPVEVGIKFTVMFKLPAPVPCVICQEMKAKPFTHNHNHGRVTTDKKKKK